MLQQRGVPYPEIRYSDRHLADAEDISLRLSFRIRPVPVRFIAAGWRRDLCANPFCLVPVLRNNQCMDTDIGANLSRGRIAPGQVLGDSVGFLRFG